MTFGDWLIRANSSATNVAGVYNILEGTGANVGHHPAQQALAESK